MFKQADSARLVHVGPGTPGGAMFRRYWQPAALSAELPEFDGAPIRVRLLGEDLIAYRDSSGTVGLVDAFCPHRRAPMFFGRNEDCGLRCVYHGWKFDATGACVDMPSEPPDSLFKTKVSIAAYPTHEEAGIVWAYLGPRELRPAPPDFEWMRAPETHRFVSKTFEDCNWLQGLEGGIDTAHSSFTHNERLGDKATWVRNRDTHPRLEVDKTPYGFTYASTRDLGDDGYYVRVYQYVMPAHQIRGSITDLAGGRAKVPKFDGHIWVPIDDVTTYVYNFCYGYDAAAAITPEFATSWETFCGRGPDDLLDSYKLKKNRSNDYMIDRNRQRSINYTGIVGINTQDMALQEGMGAIVDRSNEHLGTTDKAIIVARQLLLEAVDVVAENGAPRALDPTTYSRVRPYDDYVPRNTAWQVAFAGELEAKW